jgi:hypothetical protein
MDAVGTCLMLLPRRYCGEAVPTAKTVPTAAIGTRLHVPTACLLAWLERAMCRRPRHLAVGTEDGHQHLVLVVGLVFKSLPVLVSFLSNLIFKIHNIYSIKN